MKKNTITILFAIASSLLCACNEGTTHTYLYNDDNEVKFVDNGDKDKFILNFSHKDYDGEFIEMEFRGNFNKDSVDIAVDRYLQKGMIPQKSDLY